MSYAQVSACVNNVTIDPQCPTLAYFKQSYVNTANDALLIEFHPMFDPYGSDVAAWIDAVRSVLKAQEVATGHRLYISGGSMTFHDILTG